MHRGCGANRVADEVERRRLTGQEAPDRSLRALDAPDPGRPRRTSRPLRTLGALDTDDAGFAALPRLALRALLATEALLARGSDHPALAAGPRKTRLALATGL